MVHHGRMNTTSPLDAALIQSLAAEIASERAYRGMTQEEVWTRAGLSKSAYLKIENGQPGVSRTVEQISGIARALGLTTGELIGRAEDGAAQFIAATLPGATPQEKEDLARAVTRSRPKRFRKKDREAGTG